MHRAVASCGDTDSGRIGFSLAARVSALGTVAVAVTVLFGWLFDVRVLTSLGSGHASMKANTAVAFILAGGSLGLSTTQAHRGQQAAKWLATLAAALGAASMAEYLLGWDARIDQLVVVDHCTRAVFPGRMAPVTAAQFVLLGASLFMLDLRIGSSRPSEWLALATAVAALVALLGHLYGVRSLYAIAPYASVALLTALTFLLLSIGVLARHAHQGIVGVIVAGGPAGIMARRLIPAALLFPVLAGWVLLRGQRAGYYDTEFGVAVYASCSVVGFAALVWWTAVTIAMSAAERASIELSFKTTLESVADGVLATDSQGRLMLMNAAAKRLIGRDFEESRGRPLAEALRELKSAAAWDGDGKLARLLDEHASKRSEHFVLRAHDGTERLIAASSAPIDGHGTVLILRDETEERVTERRVREGEAHKTAILEAALDGIIEMDHRGIIIGVNAAIERTFGFSRNQLIGQELATTLIPEDLRELHRAGLARYLASGTTAVLGRRVEITALHANGREFPVELAVVRVRSEGPPLFTGYVRDLTERVRAESVKAELVLEAQTHSESRQRAERALLQTEQQLRQAQKMDALGKLAGGIAHDFNNILTVIQSYAGLLLAELDARNPLRNDLEQIARASERASALTRQLLAFSRQQTLNPRTLDLNEVIFGSVQMLRRTIGEDIDLQLALRARGFVLVDASHIEQVLLNLVVNARDAMPSGGTLTIETCDADLDQTYADEHLDVAPGRYVSLVVSDTGGGMDAETQRQMFEPFFTTKERGKGTGLGLSTVFGIVKQSGGSISACSEVGKGTTFKVHLKRVEREDPSDRKAPDSLRPSVRGSLRGTETVLLVEDDEQLRTLLHGALERHGYTVMEASTAGDGLLICEQYGGIIHLLLTDVVMPRMSGRELAERLHAFRTNTKVLFMSGYTDEAVVRHGVVSSEVDFLQKPVTFDALLAKIRELLDKAPSEAK
ncbi:MAG: PAS domain S-box protein [Myxococcota bacterium]